MRFSDFRMLAASWWAGIFGQTRISRVGEGASTTDTVRMADPTGNSPEVVIELTRLEQFGDVCVPLPECNAMIWRKSDGGVSAPLGIPNLRPSDCKMGDRALYCGTAGTVLKLHGANSTTPGKIEMRRSDGSSVAVTSFGEVSLRDSAGGTAVLNNKTLAVSDHVVAKTVTADDVSSQHFIGRGASPTVTARPGVGAGGAVLYQGTDAAFVLQITVSSGTPGPLAEVRFARSYGSVPSGLPAPGNLTQLGAAPPAAGSFYWSSVAQDAVELATATTLPDGLYLLSCVVVR
jgi:hypothetical protein